MNMDDLNLNSEKEITEDFTEILDNINKDAQELESDVEMLYHTMNTESSRSGNDDFLKLVKKADYKGFRDDEDDHHRTPKKRLKKWVYVVLVLLFIGIVFGVYKIVDGKNIAKKKEEEKRIVENIESHYNKYVKAGSDIDLYIKESNDYKKIGTLYKDVTVELEDTDIDINTTYFEIKDLGYYIKALDVIKADKMEDSDNRYKNYPTHIEPNEIMRIPLLTKPQS